MARESLKKDLNDVFERLERFLKNNEKELASFENKAIMLYDHKRYLRDLKKVLMGICHNGEIRDDSLETKKKVVELAKKINDAMTKFLSYTDIYEEDVKKFEKAEMDLLSENLNEIREKWKFLVNKKSQLVKDLEELNEGKLDDGERVKIEESFKSFIETISRVFGIEKEDYDLIYGSYAGMVHRFNDILDSQRNSLNYEIEVLREIIREFEADQFINCKKVESWIEICDKLKSELEYLVKKEKEEVHEPFNELLGKINYSKKRAIKTIESGKVNVDNINRDLSAFSRPIDYARYIDSLEELSEETGIELDKNIKKRLRAIRKIGRMGQNNVLKKVASLLIISNKDSLTRLDSRRTLEHKHKEEFVNLFTKDNIVDANNFKSKPLKKDIAFIFFDLDEFKKINDTYGHYMGDLLLKEVGSIVRKNLRANDIGIRYGGEEFLLILQNCNKEQGKSFVMDRIAKEIKSKSIRIEDENIKIKDPVTISAGVSEFNEDFNEDLIQDTGWQKLTQLNSKNKDDAKKIQSIAENIWYALVKIADERNYYIKENGRNGASTSERKKKEKKII